VALGGRHVCVSQSIVILIVEMFFCPRFVPEFFGVF